MYLNIHVYIYTYAVRAGTPYLPGYMFVSKVFLSPQVLRPDPSNVETQLFNVMEVDLGAAKLPEERRQAAQVRGRNLSEINL